MFLGTPWLVLPIYVSDDFKSQNYLLLSTDSIKLWTMDKLDSFKLAAYDFKFFLLKNVEQGNRWAHGPLLIDICTNVVFYYYSKCWVVPWITPVSESASSIFNTEKQNGDIMPHGYL